MSYERLNRLLNELEGKPVDVVEALVFKFGALLLVDELTSKAQSNRPSIFATPSEKSPEFSNILTEIQTALGKHPNVFHLENLGNREVLGIYGTSDGMLIDGSAFRMDINLPRARQKYQDMQGSEQFKIICNGSYFAAYTTIQDTPVYTNVGHEFRELAREQIERETKYKAPLFGPSPVWTDIIVAQVETGSVHSMPSIRSHEYQNDLYIVIENGANIDSFMYSLFYQAVSYWCGFYELMLRRSEMSGLDVELHNRFSEASETVQAMALIPNWKIWSTASLATRAGIEIGNIHQLIVQCDGACWNFDNQCRDYLSSIQVLPIFSKLRKITARYIRRDVRPPHSISSALQFLEKQIEVARNIRSLVLASLFGAITGALVTGLLGFFRR